MMTLSVNRIFDRWQVLQGATVFEMCPIGMVREMSVTGKCDSVSRQPFEPSQQPHTPQSQTPDGTGVRGISVGLIIPM